MKQITVDQIKALNPCSDRFNNFTIEYPNFEGTLVQFLSLENITHADKLWVCTRLMSENQKFYFARAVARTVAHIFNDAYPNNLCVTDLLDYLDTINDILNITAYQKNKILELRRAAVADAAVYLANGAYSAANAAADAANAVVYLHNGAYSAANAAANATYAATVDAADASAYAAANAAYDAAYAATVDAADAATYAAADAADARIDQQQLTLIILNEIMELDI